MINILCKHWQIADSDEFGRIFRINNASAYYDGSEQIPSSVWTKLSKVFQMAQTLEANETAPFALQEYMDEHELNATVTSSLLGKDPESVRKWLRLESKPSRNSLVRIASLLNSSPMEEEWGFQIGIFADQISKLGIRQSRIAQILGVSQVSVNNWVTHKCVPNKTHLQVMLPWITKFNELAYKLCMMTDDTPLRVDHDNLQEATD